MNRTLRAVALLAAVSAGAMGFASRAQAEDARHEVYGFVMMDAGTNEKAIDPSWFDVQRPTKLESYNNQFGKNGSVFFSVRQTRFGVKSFLPSALGEVKTQFEWEMFGVGPDAGQTTIRLRHAYGELGKWGAGQTWSPFMDIDVFPNTLEYWGPNGMAFFRNVQIRYMPIQGDTRLTIALERPGASADQGVTSDIIGATTVVPRFPVPDLSAEYRRAISRGYVEIAGIVRKMEWDDLGATPTSDLSGDAVGWGLNASSNLYFAEKKDVLRLSFLYGEGIENYMNDAPVDIGTELDPGNTVTPVKGVPLPVTGIVVFLDHTWNDKFTSSIGYSRVDIDNSSGQANDAFKTGQYVLANLLYTPVPGVMMGVEGGWISRTNKGPVAPAADAYTVDNVHLQVSAKYNFSFNPGQ